MELESHLINIQANMKETHNSMCAKTKHRKTLVAEK